ncbi:alpha/beta-hydrolase [Agrocybe pediades]|nr:alpha/beta-hydrolase [Agrocybe pediades]
MARNWDRYSRQGIDLAHTASSFGFSAAKASTRLGFSIARGLASTAVATTGAVLDLALFGGGAVARPAFSYAVSTVLTIAEQITLAPIHLSEYITSTSLLAAHSSINVLSAIFPGSSDASFSLASFIGLVRREWTAGDGTRPEKQYGLTQVARAIVGWSALQGVTQEWQEQRWLKYMREIDVKEGHRPYKSLTHKASRIRVTSDVIFPGQQGHQIIAADIGERSTPFLSRTKSHMSLRRQQSYSSALTDLSLPPLSNSELKATMRRLSKMVLAGYGGASLLFFGVSPSAFGSKSSKPKGFSSVTNNSESSALDREKKSEEERLAGAIDAAEAEADEGGSDIPVDDVSQQFSWWDVLLGKHDQEIFELSTAHGEDSPGQKQKGSNKERMKATAVIGQEHLMPRFWVLTDHSRGQVVLVIRGTMSLNEIAVDLTCEPEFFEPAVTPPSSEAEETPVPGQFTFPSISEKAGEEESRTSDKTHRPKYHVHGGMFRLARAMGDKGKPLHLAVLQALHSNPDFDLVLCGHSLGAGVAAILGMMWADPKTCLTVKSSGLPVGRQVQVYAFAPPALTDATLSRLASKLVVSLVYSHDVVSRLSLGSVRDLKNAAMWLCEAEAGDAVEGWSAVTARAKRWKNGTGPKSDMDWFIAMRKTLEANMQSANMYPPGRVFWAMRDGDLHPSHQLHRIPEDANTTSEEKLRLFEVLNVEKVFSQIVFARDMLTAHMPHQYDRVLHDLL